MASHEVQWMLCFQLTCVVQQLQPKSKQQQQQQQQQQQGDCPAVQLLAALGLAPGFYYSRYCQLSVGDRSLHVLPLLSALRNHFDAASFTVAVPGVQMNSVYPLASLTNTDPAADTTRAADPQQQQQQQQSSGSFGSEQVQCGRFLVMRQDRLRPCVLTLLQLATGAQLPASLQVLAYCVGVLHALLTACMQTSVVRLPPGTSSEDSEQYFKTLTAEQDEAVGKAQEACQSAFEVLAEPLLHRLGPAVLKAVRNVEKAQSAGQPSSSSSSSSSSRGLQQMHRYMLEV
jgi:hypothetical protein